MITPQDQYLMMQVQTASPGELTLMLYNGCIRFLKLALAGIEAKDAANKHLNIIKAQNILEELQSTLNMNYEISANLFSLYDFIRSQLIHANLHMDAESIRTCIGLMTELRDTWAQAVKQVKSGQATS
ncbi:flagellar export chaperone FliS [Cohnella thermotolerans]|uniref:flagellar export chaperone FliS n=1 Tax=Cohnella thermotolerans TaxID=329858 RepID=UPI00040F9CC2|nr:flagellar export chaperone FliS [Cohnella thermotolerans]